VILVDLDRVAVRRPDRPLFEELSVTVSSGDRLGVVGRNGSGKSTLLRVLAGVGHADDGVVRRGRDVRIGYLDQEPVLPPGTVRDAVGSHWEAAAILDRLGMAAVAGDDVSTLSGGQVKRVALAGVLVDEVDLLVLDDLGAERQTEWVLEQLFSLVNERWQDQRSILVTSNVPDPYRDVTLATLRNEIGELRRRRQNGAGRDELEAVAARLERVASQLAASDLSNDADPLTWLRQQVGSRTASRLIQICDDPLMMMGADLRMQQGA